MKKAWILAVLVTCAIVESSASAMTREECANQPGGAIWLKGSCRCGENFQLNPEKTACVPVICREDKPPVAAPAPKAVRTRKAAPEEAPPACMSLSGDRIIPASHDEEVSLEFSCDPGNRPISQVIGQGEGLKVGDKAGKGFSPMSVRKQRATKRPVTEIFKVRPLDTENPGPGKLTVFSKGKNEESPRTEVSILWPAKKLKAVETPPPPPPPPPVIDENKVACEERDGGKYHKDRIPPCECPEGSEPMVWNDSNGKLHLCRVRPLPGPKGADGKTTVIKEIIAKGDASNLLLEAQFIGLGVNGSFAGGTGLSLGYSWGFAQPVSKWHLTVRAGIIYMPTPRYGDSGRAIRDASGKEVKDWAGFMASASVSYSFHSNFAVGLGPDYLALGYRSEGRTYEFIGGRWDLIFYPVRGENATMEIFVTPRLGKLIGGRSGSGTMAAGVSAGIGVLF
jgi:hypothetical protein